MKTKLLLIASLFIAGIASADIVVTNLTAQNWQGRMGEAMGKFSQARNQKNRQVYLDALDTALYIATNCPGMDADKKNAALARYSYDLAKAMGNDGYDTGWREKQRLDLLKNAADFDENGGRRFGAALALAKREVMVCSDADLPKAEAALKAIFLNDKYSGVARLHTLSTIMHERMPVVIDVLDTAEKILASSKDPAVHAAFYVKMAEYMSYMYGGWEWGQEQIGIEPLNPKYSYESQLAMVERGLADPLVGSNSWLIYRKAWILTMLERFDEAGQVYLSQTTNTNLAERADAFVNYARFLESRAKRFYTPKWQPYLKQAEAAYLQAMALGVGPKTPNNWAFKDLAADCAIELGDFGVARMFLDGIVKANRGNTNDFVRIRLGRIAWAEKDYEGVVRHMPPIDSKLNTREQYPIADRALIAKSLKLLGREEEELAALEALSKKADRNWKSYYTFAYERLKEKLGK